MQEFINAIKEDIYAGAAGFDYCYCFNDTEFDHIMNWFFQLGSDNVVWTVEVKSNILFHRAAGSINKYTFFNRTVSEILSMINESIKNGETIKI